MQDKVINAFVRININEELIKKLNDIALENCEMNGENFSILLKANNDIAILAFKLASETIKKIADAYESEFTKCRPERISGKCVPTCDECFKFGVEKELTNG